MNENIWHGISGAMILAGAGIFAWGFIFRFSWREYLAHRRDTRQS